MRGIVFAAGVLFSVSSFALPQEIMIIRHADKSLENSGYFVDPTGYMRAINFEKYYSRLKYPAPDYIFITKSYDKGKFVHSSRELQTVAPLINKLQTEGKKVKVDFPYAPSDYKKLAQKILTDKKYDGKFILICWEHGRIPQLASALGVTPEPKKWPGADYDSVYLLNYSSGHTPSFQVLDNQYPTPQVNSWDKISA